MSPLPIPTDVASLESWRKLFEPKNSLSTASLLFLFAIVVCSIAVNLGKRRRSVSRAGTDWERSIMEQELVLKQRKDSSQGEQEQVSGSKEKTPVFESEKQPRSKMQKDDKVRHSSPERRPNDYLESLKQETLQPSLSPIYPWIAPPQQLPGPYDAPYYPLPLPTIQLQKDRETEGRSEREMTPDIKPEELETIVYSRRVPTNNSATTGPIREEVVTVSNKGWRRTQWTINTG